jgi:hypothetical protein
VSRHERARVVCNRVAERVAVVAPSGLGRWGHAWAMVEAPSTAFLDALLRWEHAETDEEALRDEVRAAADTLVQAWTDAAKAWDAAGRPSSGMIQTERVEEVTR